jgi:predicted nucleic acid-binding protein
VTSDHSAPSILLDASALIALLGGEPAAADVQAILRDGGAGMTTLNLAESVDRLERRYGITSTRARPVIEGLLDDALMLVPLGPAEAWRAAEIRAGHYHRTRCPISLADAVLVASAGTSRTVASADRHVLAVAASEGVAATQLPGSRGPPTAGLTSHGHRESRTTDA